jgi:UDP-galactopyranose mutase
VEEPVYEDGGEPRWQITNPAPRVSVRRPVTPVKDAPGYCDAQYPHLRELIRELVAERAGADYDLWCYTPMADGLTPQVVVFDNMDDLSAFKFAPPEIRQREADLLARADAVFTGGPSLYRAMKDRHPNAHCLGSSVDTAHFAKALGALPEPPEQAGVPRPRLGYFGVLDERFDVPLLDAAAAARPDWQFVMVGPVAKIDPASLPKRPNVHYAGQQPYAVLPNFLAGWDVRCCRSPGTSRRRRSARRRCWSTWRPASRS